MEKKFATPPPPAPPAPAPAKKVVVPSTSSKPVGRPPKRHFHRARKDSIVNNASNIPVVFGRVVFIKHILLFAVDSRDPFAGLQALFSWRLINSAWLDSIHNYVDEIWRPIISRAHKLYAYRDDFAGRDDEGFSIAKQLFFCRDAEETTAAHLDVIRLFASKGLDIKKPFAIDSVWEDLSWRSFSVHSVLRYPGKKLPAFAYAFLADNYSVLKLLAELDPECATAPFTLRRVVRYSDNGQLGEHPVTATPLVLAAYQQDEKMLDFLLSLQQHQQHQQRTSDDEQISNIADKDDDDEDEDSFVAAADVSDEDDGDFALDTDSDALAILISHFAIKEWTPGWKYIELMLERCGSAAARTSTLQRCSPLVFAAQCRNIELLQFFLEHGLDPNVAGEPHLDAHCDCASCNCCANCICPRPVAVGHDDWRAGDLLCRVVPRCGEKKCKKCRVRPEFDAEKAVAGLTLLMSHGADFSLLEGATAKFDPAEPAAAALCPPAIAACIVGDAEMLRQLAGHGGARLETRFCMPQSDGGGNVVTALSIAVEKMKSEEDDSELLAALIDDLKMPLHLDLLLGGGDSAAANSFFDDADGQRRRLSAGIAHDTQKWLVASPLDSPTRQLLHHLRAHLPVRTKSPAHRVARQFLDNLEAQLAEQFAEFAAACRSGDVERVSKFVRDNGLSRCHWPDTDAPDFVREVLVANRPRQIVDARSFGMLAKPGWAACPLPQSLKISRYDKSWTAFSKMTLQKVFCYTPAAARDAVVKSLVEKMEATTFQCL